MAGLVAVARVVAVAVAVVVAVGVGVAVVVAVELAMAAAWRLCGGGSLAAGWWQLLVMAAALWGLDCWGGGSAAAEACPRHGGSGSVVAVGQAAAGVGGSATAWHWQHGSSVTA